MWYGDYFNKLKYAVPTWFQRPYGVKEDPQTEFWEKLYEAFKERFIAEELNKHNVS